MGEHKQTTLHATRNDLGANVRETSVAVLNATLADTMDLTNAVRMAHWTVRGTHFTGLRAGMDHVQALAERYAMLAKAVRAGVGATGDAGDADTSDLLTGYSRTLDKALWMLDAHLDQA